MIIAFTGKKGNGKDTAAQALLLTGRFRQIGFADPVKLICHHMFYLQPEEMADPTLKQRPLRRWPHKTPRELMQNVAQFARDKYPGIWVISWERRVREILNQGHFVVTTDLRYLDEEKVIKAMGGYIIRVKRPEVAEDEFSSHPSETELEQIKDDETIINDGTKEELQDKVRKICKIDEED